MDKNGYIQEYLRAQERFLGSYITEGPPLLSDNNGSTPESQKAGQGSAMSNFGFDTPLLKPRRAGDITALVNKKKFTLDSANSPRANAKYSKATKTTQNEVSAIAKASNSKPTVKDKRIDKPQRVNSRALSPRKPSEKKNKRCTVDSDDECAARLSERRERKRLKRSIVDPVESNDSSQIDSTANRSKKAKNGKAKKTKISAALALMHGFSATNVGKSRITIKPSINGVFGRGKASAKAIVKNKATSIRKSRNTFLEEAFLNPTRPRAFKAQSISSSSVSPTECPSPSKKIRIANSNRPKENKSRKVDDNDTSSESDSEIPDENEISASRAEKLAESDVWAIELEDRPLPSGSALSVHEGRAASSVVLDVRSRGWFNIGHDTTTKDKPCIALSNVHANPQDPPSGPSDNIAVGNHSTLDYDQLSSIHPSHSASQVGRPLRGEVLQSDLPKTTISKYFPPARTMPRIDASDANSSIAHHVRPSDSFECSAKQAALKHYPRDQVSEIGRLTPDIHVSNRLAVSPVFDNMPINAESSRQHTRAITGVYPTDGGLYSSSTFDIVDVDSTQYILPAITQGADSNDSFDSFDGYHEHHFPSTFHRGQDSMAAVAHKNVQCLDFEPTTSYFDQVQPPGEFESTDISLGDYYEDSPFEPSLLEPLDEDFAPWSQQDPFDQVGTFHGSLQSFDDPSANCVEPYFELPLDGYVDEPVDGQYFPDDDDFLGNTPFFADVYQNNILEDELQPDQARPSSSCSSIESGYSDGMAASDGRRFCQGRALLLGLSTASECVQENAPANTLSLAEVDIAKRLKDHWRPQKF